jgi:phage terminase Nu1 subunit (DNA packaging protein)
LRLGFFIEYRTSRSFWINRGAPVYVRDEKGRIRLLNLLARRKWRLSREDLSSLEKERTRLTKAQADHEAFKDAQARAEQIPIDIVIAAWQAPTATTRALVAASFSPAHIAVEARDPQEVERWIRDEIDKALDDLSTHQQIWRPRLDDKE